MTTQEALPRLVLLCGSRKPHPSQPEQKSAARELLKFLYQTLPNGVVEVSVVDLRDFDIPFFDGRLPGAYACEDIERLSEALRQADGIIVAAPAYWGGVAGVLKNVIDVLAGPAYLDGASASILTGKPVGLLVVGANDVDAHGAAIQLRTILGSTGSWVLPTQVVIGNPQQLGNLAQLAASIQALGEQMLQVLSVRRPPAAALSAAPSMPPASAPSIVEIAFDTKAFNELAKLVLATLTATGLTPPAGGWLDVESYLSYQALVKEHFLVPQTSVTPLMARILYALASARRPRNIVAIGTYMGYALAWLVGPVRATGTAPPLPQALAIDIDPEATAGAQHNFRRLGLAAQVECICEDGLQALSRVNRPIDLLYLDVDSPTQGKKLYRPLLELAYPHLAEQALVLAHDICVPQFTEDLAPYLARVRDTAYFKHSLALPFDFCGLEVSIR